MHSSGTEKSAVPFKRQAAHNLPGPKIRSRTNFSTMVCVNEMEEDLSTLELTEDASPAYLCFHETEVLSTIDEWYEGDSSWFEEEEEEDEEPEYFVETTNTSKKIPNLVIIEGGPCGNNYAATDVSHDAVTPKARSSSFPREVDRLSHKQMNVMVHDIAKQLVQKLTIQAHHVGSSSSWTSTTSSTSSVSHEARRFRKKRVILIGEDGDELDELVFDKQLEISSS